MIACRLILACGLAVAACAAVGSQTDTSQLPPFFYGVLVDNDIGAINEASWALGSPSRTRNDPVEALRAAIAIEYLAGELNTNPRWAAMSPLTKMQMLDARTDMRRALGIAPNAPSQLVVNTLTAAMLNLMRGYPAAAQQVLSGPIFTQPSRTMQALWNLPPVPAARAATAAAEAEEFPRNG